MIERQLDLTTADGEMTTFVCHPEVPGPHPVVLYLMDAPSVRPALRDMASRLATAGYYVMLPYLFYRGGRYREFGASDEDMHARRDLMATVTPTGIVTDAEALMAFADADPAARRGVFGAVGFCMSGGLTLAVARRFPDRVTAVASIHGAWLVRDSPDSPHLGLEGLVAEMYLGWCDDDPTAPVADLQTLLAALDTASIEHTHDFYTDAVHGYAPPGTDRYHRYASEQHWERVHDLMRRKVQNA